MIRVDVDIVYHGTEYDKEKIRQLKELMKSFDLKLIRTEMSKKPNGMKIDKYTWEEEFHY